MQVCDSGIRHVVGFSGGIDSQACARWVLNRYPAEEVVLLNSDAGGNEHPMTTEFIRWYSEHVHPVVEVSAVVGDMGGRARAKRQELGLADDDVMDFATLAILKGRWPWRRAQFCTEYLKLTPQRRWIEANLADYEIVRYSGVRRDESEKRSNQRFEEWDDFYDCKLVCPIADWSKQMCFDYVQAHGEEFNGLYKLGFNRVGCAPCINSGKEDIRAWVDRFPEMIDKVRDWEKRVGRTFFAPCVPGKAINWIDEVVEWSKTVWGGKQYGLHILHERPACESKYGVCE